MASLDMYRKVPADLLEGTKRGSFLSVAAIFVIMTLFILETKAFFEYNLASNLSLDSNEDKRIRVNFNITMMDLKCEYAVIDVKSALSTEQNVTQHVTKFQLDAEGVEKRYHGRNMEQHDLALFDDTVKETIEELHEDGEDAVPLDAGSLEIAKRENRFLFVDFFASWCSHCRDLAPTWETLAEIMDTAASRIVDKDIEQANRDVDWTDEEYEHAIKVALPVMIAKVDCVLHPVLCSQQNIMAYPTLKLFVDGEQHGADYRGHRTIIDFTDYLATVEEDVLKDKGAVDYADKIAVSVRESRGGSIPADKTRRKLKKEWKVEDHPGCQLSGFMMVDRVPGNFHIMARSPRHDLAPTMTNVSHEVHHLSFGEPYIRRKLEKGMMSSAPPGLLESTVPMDGNVYVTKNEHEAHHHYLKVVTASVEDGDYDRRIYQVLQQSQLSYYNSDIVPEAKFQYDLSPIAVAYKTTSRKWYDYLTSIMAIVGGTFTVVGLLESSIHAVSSKKRR